METKELKNRIQALWIGGKLSLFEWLSIASFIKNGHDYHLYTYEKIKVPQGVILKDANRIIPKKYIFRNEIWSKSYTQFANNFRFKLLLEKGGWWCDTDIICLKKFDFKEKYVFGYQDERTICTAITFCHPHTELMAELYSQAEKIGKTSEWGATGPKLLTRTVKALKLTRYAKNREVFFPIYPTELPVIFKPNKKIPSNSYALHLWNEIIRLIKIDKNCIYPKNTIIGKLQNLYLTPHERKDYCRKMR